MIFETLKNGIEVCIKEDHFSKAVSVQCWVHAGSMHERPDQRGMAHFLEHMLFKGTEKRKVGEIGTTVELCGGNINAYTTFDRTVYYLTVLSEYTELGIDLLSDAIFNSIFDKTEVEREREVILEEIKRGLDNPGQTIARKIFATCYDGSEIGRPVIGNVELVSKFTRENLLEFHRQWYCAPNMSIVIVGDVDAQETLRLVQQYFGETPRREVPKIAIPKQTFPEKPLVTLFKDDYKLPKLEIVFPAPDVNHHDTPFLDIASYALGSGDVSRLNLKLKEQEGVVAAVSASCFSPCFPGLFSISAHANEDTYLQSITRIMEEYVDLFTQNLITEEELNRARVNFRADLIYRDETVEGQARGLGFGLTTPQKLMYDEVYTQIVEKTPLSIVNGVLKRWFNPDRVVIVGMLNKDSKITEAEVLQAYKQGITQAFEKKTSVVKALKHSTYNGQNIDLVKLDNGVKFIYKQNPLGGVFAINAVTEGGMRAEQDANAGIFNAISGLLTEANEHQTHEELMKQIEDHGASLHGFSGKDSIGLAFSCIASEMEKLLPTFTRSLLEPVFTEEQWEISKLELRETFASQFDSPSSICMRLLQQNIFKHHPYQHPIYGLEDSVASFTATSLMDYFKSFRDQGEWVLSAVGPYHVDEITALLNKLFKGWKPKNTKRAFHVDQIKNNLLVKNTIHYSKKREQAHIAYGTRGLDWFDPDRAALDVLVNILGGHGGRLFMSLREEKSLAYSVAPIVNYGCHPGLVGSYIACAPNKKQEAIDGMRIEFEKLQKTLVSADELDRSKKNIIGSHEMGLQKAASQAMTMALMELYGVGYDDFTAIPKRIAKVTSEDVQRVAKRLFEKDFITVVVGPE